MILRELLVARKVCLFVFCLIFFFGNLKGWKIIPIFDKTLDLENFDKLGIIFLNSFALHHTISAYWGYDCIS